MKWKSPILASVLGLILGPFSSMYFGIIAFLITIFVVIMSIGGAATALNSKIPEWFILLNLPFFSLLNYMCIRTYNETQFSFLAMANGGIDKNDLKAFYITCMPGWYVRFAVITIGLYRIIILISEDRWGMALATLFIFIPLVIWVLGWMIGAFIGLASLPVLIIGGMLKNKKEV